MTEKNILKVIEAVTKEILKLLGIEKSQLTLSEENGFISVAIKTPEVDDDLIGRSGENLGSLQLIIGLVVYKKTGKWQKILLNINDWRQKREQYLQQLAANLAQKVKFSGREIQLTNLTPAERRVIHLYLADHPDVTTCSEGTSSHRRLIIKPK